MKKIILSLILLVAGNAFSKSIEFHGIIADNIELKGIGYYEGPCVPTTSNYWIFACKDDVNKVELPAAYSTYHKGKKYYRITFPSRSPLLVRSLISAGLAINNKFKHKVEGVNLKPGQYESMQEVEFGTQFIFAPGGFSGSYSSIRNPGVFSKVILLKNGNVQLVKKSGELVTPENWELVGQEYRTHRPLEDDLSFRLDIESE